ncbi:hypothetical protein B484DRAFT_18384 [Ochromonadaceae sp. CCMP2298]|nr:hypothetical protein B484DRAFT_18851 [Ochromonadaceae sp. CCMP2298]KAJ1432987.1 hypothetical protein B484DRAFT_18384 [Ochromonadaceae sp. CCMP2298]
MIANRSTVVSTVKLVLLFTFVQLCSSNYEWVTNTKSAYDEHRDQLAEILFPDQTVSASPKHLRELAIFKETPTGNEPCVTCSSLTYCKALNEKIIEEKYYPNNLENAETCNVLEAVGKRLSQEIFGNGRTFRDTDQCRAIVMQYLCLFYGSNNPMYRNYCTGEFTDPVSGKKRDTPKPPCRSFCVQVASISI